MLYGTDSAYIFLKPENNFRHFTGTAVLKRIVLFKYNFASPGTTSVYENESQDGVFSAFQEYSNPLFSLTTTSWVYRQVTTYGSNMPYNFG